jgi:hypothetical protein
MTVRIRDQNALGVFVMSASDGGLMAKLFSFERLSQLLESRAKAYAAPDNAAAPAFVTGGAQ